MRESVAILGAGAWGTALAVHLCTRAHARPAVRLWARSHAQASAMASTRENATYLPGVPLPASIEITADLVEAARADILIVATPVSALTAIATELVESGADVPLLWLSKGFVEDEEGWALPHQRIAPMWRASVGIVSGPSFA
jgi:glycerol-3-phosphate dehydrogenase (NAD(P)+)